MVPSYFLLSFSKRNPITVQKYSLISSTSNMITIEEAESNLQECASEFDTLLELWRETGCWSIYRRNEGWHSRADVYSPHEVAIQVFVDAFRLIH